MKKSVIATLSAMALVGLVGCSTGGEANSTPSPQENQTVSTPVDQNENNNETNSPSEVGEISMVYGKISKLIGNEIEVNLAEDPFAGLDDEAEAPEGVEAGSGVVMADTIEPITGSVTAMESMELEYTGETASYTIPAGLSMMNYMTGAELSMNDLKEGSVVAITISGSGETMQILGVDVLE